MESAEQIRVKKYDLNLLWRMSRPGSMPRFNVWFNWLRLLHRLWVAYGGMPIFYHSGIYAFLCMVKVKFIIKFLLNILFMGVHFFGRPKKRTKERRLETGFLRTSGTAP